MQYRICPTRPGEYEIEVRDDEGRRWLARVARTDDGDLLVQVFGLRDAPPQVIEAEVLTHTVGYWWRPAEAGPDDLAGEVIRCLATRPQAD